MYLLESNGGVCSADTSFAVGKTSSTPDKTERGYALYLLASLFEFFNASRVYICVRLYTCICICMYRRRKGERERMTKGVLDQLCVPKVPARWGWLSINHIF